MIKLVFCLRRLETLTPTEFRHHWRERHAPLVRRHASALGIRRYVQLDPTADAGAEALRSIRDGPPAWDGIAELWFDSEAELRAAGATTVGRAAAIELRRDEERFIDLTRSPIWLYAERVVL